MNRPCEQNAETFNVTSGGTYCFTLYDMASGSLNIIITNLLGSIFNILPAFVRRWEIKKCIQEFLFRKFAYMRHGVV
jgi:hypothetical protein